MKKNGFTTVELIASFSIASSIMLLLFNVVIIMKGNLSTINSKTNLLVSKDNLSYNINKKLQEKELSSLTTCADGSICYLFTYSDSTSDKLIYDSTNNSITFNNYTFEISDDMTLGTMEITEHYDTMSSTNYNGYFIINIPLTLDSKDYSINILHYFNTANLSIVLS